MKMMNILLAPFRLIVSVVVSIKNRIGRGLKRRKQQKKDYEGIYIVQYSPNTIKIGRSKQIEKRLRSYRGYQRNAADITRIMIIKTKNHIVMEKQLHTFASDQGLQRFNRCEVFLCNDIPKFKWELQKQLRKYRNIQQVITY